MTLDREDIEAIASAVVRKMLAVEEVELDQAYEASLPIEEQKRRQQKRMQEFKKRKKGGLH